MPFSFLNRILYFCEIIKFAEGCGIPTTSRQLTLVCRSQTFYHILPFLLSKDSIQEEVNSFCMATRRKCSRNMQV